MLNKIMFVADGDEGHNQWKCLACNSQIDAGYPRYDYSGENPVVVDSGYKFCPICGVKFEGVHPNRKMGTLRSYPFDVTESMTYRYRQLGWIAEAIRRQRADFVKEMGEYRNEVAEFLDELDEYQCRDLKVLRPRCRVKLRV